ncbi:TonB-dependent receptor plug domain-containing protein [Pseudochryseolinea flava]|uniref:TonB-dependent receptor plug domain-containing protein n=1 Tax=Pseudochryseolinea flava TaxID=2059302 RepID=A0A364Y8M8_9BACT|nr:TonB-dependent receptor plug domain-containing protein [Pseudochryseolinea flava]RAW03263.1 hypothetical protein DQQ10_04040 [Pseudochryseolinea flava]
MKKHLYYSLLFCFLFGALPTLAQEQQPAEDVDLYSLSLEELMNVPINSASKKDETLFDAPLSSYTITRADIDKSGATSIMEALRLAPGVIVREQTNGVYDIHLRGFDNILRTSEDFTKSNLTTLVMIDNRPVFNHNLGGTFWEAIPVDLNDVERIEIVRGPSAPLFGPNAVTGVINIITKRIEKDGFYTNASVSAGTPMTTIVNGSVGARLREKFNFIVSANYQNRERFDDDYYKPVDDSYSSAEDVFGSTAANLRFKDTKLALEKWGVNGFLNFAPSDKLNFDLSLGLQDATTQKNFLGSVNGSPYTTGETDSKYINLSAQAYGFHIRGQYQNGHDDLNVNAPPNEYDFAISDVSAEYEIKLGEKASIVPGFSFQHVNYDDTDYYDPNDLEKREAFLNGTSASISTTSGFLRTDVRPVKNLRIVAAVRADKFSSPDDVYLAYEFASTYKINDKNLIRAAVTRSNSGSFIGVNNLNLVVVIPGLNVVRSGNEEVKLLTVNMVEVGFRTQLTKGLQLDFDIFRQHAKDFNAILVTNVAQPIPGVYVPNQQQFRNVPTTATQIGATFSINYVPNEKIQIKPFFTIQKTETEDLLNTETTPETSNPNSDYYDPAKFDVTFYDSKHTHTPSVYGGYLINFKASEKFNINLNGYFFSSHRQYAASDDLNTSKAGDIKSTMLVNLKVNYAITKQINIFANGRNILNSETRQYFGTDKIGGVYLLGAAVNIN